MESSVQSPESRIQGSESRVQGLEFRVQSSGVKPGSNFAEFGSINGIIKYNSQLPKVYLRVMIYAFVKPPPSSSPSYSQSIQRQPIHDWRTHLFRYSLGVHLVVDLTYLGDRHQRHGVSMDAEHHLVFRHHRGYELMFVCK